MLGGVILRIIPPPTVVLLLGDLSCLEHGRGLTPSMEHPTEFHSFCSSEHVHSEANFPIDLTYFQSVIVLQSEQRAIGGDQRQLMRS